MTKQPQKKTASRLCERQQAKACLLLPIDITNVWSDQLPGVHANWIQKGATANDAYKTGQSSKPYILMGERFDGKAYVKAKTSLPLPEELDEYLLFRLMVKDQDTPKDGNSTYNSGNGEISITADELEDEEKDYVIVAGGDSNGNSQLDSDEVTYKNEWVFKIVSGTAYANRFDELIFYKSTIPGAPLTKKCIDAFLAASTPVGASSQTTQIDRFPLYATHAAGILFTPETGPGTSIKAIFDPSSDMTATVMNSTALKNWLESEFDLKRTYVQQTLNNSANTIETFNWQLPAMNLDFTVLDWDLKFSLGHVSSLGPIHVMLKVEVATGETTEVKVTGTLNDLYDFDYDGSPSTFVKPAACLQAGYDTVGIAGRVYKNNVQMNNSPWPREYDFN